MSRGTFSESRPLGITHHAPTVGTSAAELPPGNQRRLGRAGVSPLQGENIGKVHTSGEHVHRFLSGADLGLWGVLKLQGFRTAELAYQQGLHAGNDSPPGTTVMPKDPCANLPGRYILSPRSSEFPWHFHRQGAGHLNSKIS